MTTDTKRHRKPAIVLTKTDYERLLRLAEAHALRNPEVSEEHMVELDRARVVQNYKIASNVVRMGSTVRFTSDLGEDRTVTLVFPGE
ncbi:MAG: nucleoside diphosphate kinase regulator, partial [Pseudomonadota bacterium]|nr:nucleoside diphosphate kinase regulator [Pseudomonadota bacterium]